MSTEKEDRLARRTAALAKLKAESAERKAQHVAFSKLTPEQRSAARAAQVASRKPHADS